MGVKFVRIICPQFQDEAMQLKMVNILKYLEKKSIIQREMAYVSADKGESGRPLSLKYWSSI